MGGTKTMWSEPYREPSKPEDPLTDLEMTLWDAIMANNAVNCNLSELADRASKVIDIRRKKFGVR